MRQDRIVEKCSNGCIEGGEVSRACGLASVEHQSDLVWNPIRLLVLQSPFPPWPSSLPSPSARTILRGHSNTIEDIVFKPRSVEQLASVGDDHALLFWDTRVAGGVPSLRVDQAHGRNQDVQCVDWATEVWTRGWDGMRMDCL